MQVDQIMEDWMSLVEPDAVVRLPFGQAAATSFDLYPCYEHYFDCLVETSQLIRAERPNDQQLLIFLQQLDQYVRLQVRKGHSDYAAYNDFLQSRFQHSAGLEQTWRTLCRSLEQPELPLLAKSDKVVPEEVKEVQQNRKVQIPFEVLKVKHSWRPSTNIVLVGHVDHGKSTFLGRLLSQYNVSVEQSGGHNTQILTTYTDIYAKEKQRGKTIEFSTINISNKHGNLTFFDTPGHKNYMSNMLMALRIADCILLIVSAKKGELEAALNGGTLRQILLLADRMNKQSITIVVTKMATCNWNADSFNNVQEEVKRLIKNLNCSFKTVDFVSFDSLQKKNRFVIKEKFDKLSFADDKLINRDLRAPIFDIQPILGGRRVFCKIQSGFLLKGMHLTIYPEQQHVQIGQIFHGDTQVQLAACGDFISLSLKGLSQNVERGDMLTAGKTIPTCTNQLKCQVDCITDLLVSGSVCVLHFHQLTIDVEIQVESKESDGKWLVASFLRQNQKGIIRVKLKKKICFDRELHKSVIIRNGDRTVSYGKVLSARKEQ